VRSALKLRVGQPRAQRLREYLAAGTSNQGRGHHANPEDVIARLRDNQVTLTFDAAAGTLHAKGAAAIHIVTRKEAS
jgi:hypothetical protein